MKIKHKILILFALVFCGAFSALSQSTSTYGSNGVEIGYGPTLPAACTPLSRRQSLFHKTGTAAGLYRCSAANTWTQIGAGGGTVTGTGTTNIIPKWAGTSALSASSLTDDAATVTSTVPFVTSAAGYFGYTGRSRIYSPSNGAFNFRNAANNADADINAGAGNFTGALNTNGSITASLGNLVLGGSASVGQTGYYGVNFRSRLYSMDNGTWMVTDSTGTDFDRFQFGGNTNAYPALKRLGTSINIRLADDSANASLISAKVTASDDVVITDATKGVVLKAPNATCYRVTVTNAGTLATASITCP